MISYKLLTTVGSQISIDIDATTYIERNNNVK